MSDRATQPTLVTPAVARRRSPQGVRDEARAVELTDAVEIEAARLAARESRRRWIIAVGRIGLLVAALGATEYVVRAGIVDTLVLAAPSDVARSLFGLAFGGRLPSDFAVTLGEFATGFALSAAAGIALGLLIARVRVVEDFTKPFLAGLMAVPKVAIIPVLAIWLGIGFASKVSFVILFSFFSVFYNTIAGVQQTPANLIKVSRALGANGRQLTTKVLLPSAVPAIFAGLRVGVASGLAGALFGEMLASQAGLGNLLVRSAGFYDTPQLFSAVAVTALLALVAIKALDLVEKEVFLRWKTR